MASRRRPKPSGGDDGADEVAAPGQDDFLDESEQVQVVEELRRQQREHARNYRRLYQALAALLLLALLYCSLMAVLGPVHLEHHHIFSKSVGPLGFLLSYLAHAASALGGLAIVSPPTPAPSQGKAELALPSWIGFGCALVNLLGWLSVFSRQDARPHWSFWWLPCAGMGVLVLALYLDAEVRRMEQEIGGLEKLKYNYKTI